MSGPRSLSRRASLAWVSLVVLGLVALPSQADAPAKTQTVSIVFDSGHGKPKTVDAIEWKKGMTAWEATQAAVRRPPALRIEHTGKGATVFVTSIDGLKNQGGQGDKLNWQFWLNGAFADEGVGAKVLQAGDKVVWKFAPPPPEGSW